MSSSVFLAGRQSRLTGDGWDISVCECRWKAQDEKTYCRLFIFQDAGLAELSAAYSVYVCVSVRGIAHILLICLLIQSSDTTHVVRASIYWALTGVLKQLKCSQANINYYSILKLFLISFFNVIDHLRAITTCKGKMCVHCSIYLFVTCFTQQPVANSSNHLPTRWEYIFFLYSWSLPEVSLVMKALVDEKHFKKKLKQALKYAWMHLKPS